MRGLMLASLGTAASVGCAFAAVGVALYGGSGNSLAAALVYGGFGVCAGGVCGVLDRSWQGLPASARGPQGGHRPGLAAGEAGFRPSRFGA